MLSTFDNIKLTKVAVVTKSQGNNGDFFAKIISQDKIKKIKKDKFIFIDIDASLVPFKVEKSYKQGNLIFFKLNYINSKNDLQKLLGKYIYINNDEENNKISLGDEILQNEENNSEDDVLNYQVIDKQKGYIGVVSNINYIPGNPVIEVMLDEKTIIIPYNENIVLQINDDEKQIFIDAPEGLIDIYLEL